MIILTIPFPRLFARSKSSLTSVCLDPIVITSVTASTADPHSMETSGKHSHFRQK